MELSFQPFDHKKNLADQRMLFRECFPETIGKPIETHEHYFWKFHSFPAERKSYEYAAFSGGDLIGYYAAIPYRYRVGDKMMTIAMVCDVMTGVKARGKGVFTKLGFFSTDALKEEGLDFTTGYPIRPEVIPGHLKVKWKIAFDMPVYISFLKANAVLKAKKLSFLAPLGNLGVKLFNGLFSKSGIVPGYDAETLDKEQFFKVDDYNQFFEKWEKSIRNPLIKNMEFLRWRLGAPGTDYKIILIRKSGELTGISITRKSEMEGIPVLAILDMMLLHGNEKAMPLINHALQSIARNIGAEAIVTMMSPKWAQSYRLSKLGFLKSPYKFSLIIKKLNPAIEDHELYDEVHWHLMWIDSDDL